MSRRMLPHLHFCAPGQTRDRCVVRSLVCLAVALCLLPAKAAVTQFASSFETGDDGYRVKVDLSGAGGTTPVVSFDWASADAAHTGSRGLQINVLKQPARDWQVQFQTPNFPVQRSRLYTFCVWVRMAPWSPTQYLSNSTLDMWNAQGDAKVTATPLAGPTSPNSVIINASWRRACLREVQPPGQMTSYINMQLGAVPAVYHLDDASLEYDDLDMGWADPAAIAARIDTHRRAALTLRPVAGETGQPLAPGALVGGWVRLVRHEFPFGTSFEPSALTGFNRDWYYATAASMFNALVNENSFKWRAYEPAQGRWQAGWNYINNSTIDFAQANDMVLVRGHNLEWYQTLPPALTHWSRRDGCEAYKGYLETRIRRDVGMFRGKYLHYDIINEPLHERRYLDECGLWDTTFLDAFRWAHEADPTALLCLNDYQMLDGGQDNRWQQMHDLVYSMQQKNVPISCLGLQAYLAPNRLSPELMAHRLSGLASLGLPLYITEFLFPTGRLANGNLYSGLNDQELADFYTQMMTLWFSHPAVQGMFMWGFWDGQIWVKNSGLFYTDKRPKPAAYAVQKLLKQDWNTTLTLGQGELLALSCTGQLSLRATYGRYEYELEGSDGSTHRGTFELKKTAGPDQTVALAVWPAPPGTPQGDASCGLLPPSPSPPPSLAPTPKKAGGKKKNRPPPPPSPAPKPSRPSKKKAKPPPPSAMPPPPKRSGRKQPPPSPPAPLSPGGKRNRPPRTSSEQ